MKKPARKSFAGTRTISEVADKPLDTQVDDGYSRKGEPKILSYLKLAPPRQKGQGRVVLKFHGDIADIVAERIRHPSEKITRHRDGSLTLEMDAVISDELEGWVASWREWVEVVGLETHDTRTLITACQGDKI